MSIGMERCTQRVILVLGVREQLHSRIRNDMPIHQLISQLDDLIQFKRGKYLDRVLRTAPHEEAVASMFKHTGLRALPTRGLFNRMIKRDSPWVEGLTKVAKDLKAYRRPRVLSMLDQLIEFKTVKWEDNPLYPEDVKSTVRHVPIKKIVSHQNAVKRHIVEEYKKKPGRDLPMLHKVGGKYFVEDGNHRIVAKKEKGEKTVRARVFEKELIAKLDELINFASLHQPRREDEPPGKLPTFREGEFLDYNVQRHHARRAGLHRDVRIGNKQHGLLSWATRKDLPSPGKSIAIHEQPTHPHSYAGWSGEIPSGYGAGQVASEELRKALVTKSSEDQLHATLGGQKGSHRVAFVKTKHGWLFSKGKAPQPPKEAEKPPAKSLSPKEAKGYLKDLPPGASVQPKLDGALVYVTTKGGRPEIFSHRVSKVTGKHPIHTERVFRGRPTIDIPREHQRTLVGELYGKIRGKAIPPQQLGGILNAHVDESIRKQQASGVKLKVMPFDYVDGQDEQYAERLAKVRQTLKHLPGDVFHPPEEAKTPQAALRLHEKIRAGQHPLTSEGVVIHPPHGKLIKVKHTGETNVKITGTFPGKGKYEGSYGGFTYGTGGKVGSGFSDETRAELHKYIGRSARIRHQGEYKTGKHRAPVFIAVNE